jgi:hypothetical protein
MKLATSYNGSTVSRQVLAAENRVRSKAISRWIFSGQDDNGARFSRRAVLSSQSHFINAPYSSFMRLPPMLYNLSK